MKHPQSITYRDHTIEPAGFFDEDTGQWSVQCVIVTPDGQRSSPIACRDPMWVSSEKEAVRISQELGKRVVNSGQW